ncbi:Fucose 4-O-acetylase [Nonomuraea maritima]|uniref:Fucose 4-O-acetylase n=1 Tax=Nonomuraea maritima TaxID=683260 RepID=A0A1G9IJE1_9ACTN|nr:acyltransferase [Nonomuraea maritima]SDL25033.1 Fucose 4-O-acetylase [Nonomuraea maritima]
MPLTAGALREMRRLAEETPARRDRHVDLLRAVAIGAVVLGHWLVTHVAYDGRLHGGNALDLVSWTAPFTWLFQVMPLFFLVGGYSNASSLASHRGRGGDTAAWMLRRTDRLLRPTTLLLAVLTAVAVSGNVAGGDPGMVGMAVWLAGIPLWFLAAYLAVVVLTPVTHAVHRRYGLAVPVVLAVLVCVGDAARLTGWAPALGQANYLFAWLAMHQVGFAWQDGRLPARPRVGLPLAAVGATLLVLLTVLGPYPLSMVGANTSPPTLALLALATTQIGLGLAVHDASCRWLRRLRPWTVVVAVNAVIMTIFLWHMTAALIGAVLLYPSGMLAAPPPGTPLWLLLRLPWLVALALVLLGLVAVFGPVERRSGPCPAAGARAGTVAGVLACSGMAVALAGLLGIAMAGPGDHGVTGMPVVAVAGYFAGATTLRLTRARSRRAQS